MIGNSLRTPVLCKFFAHGACLKGEHCEFSHDWKDSPNIVCTFYAKGSCSYGSRCRYDHVKPRSTGQQAQRVGAAAAAATSVPTGQFHAPGSSSSAFGAAPAAELHVDMPAVMCSFAAVGHCPRGEKCPHVHGHLCPSCGKHCLHPSSREEREGHMKSCQRMQKHIETLKNSQDIECSVCLERVLSKPTPSERKFGLLSDCDHPFCISCIRNWRGSSDGSECHSLLRTCPICRKLSHFVIPSVIWYSTTHEKQQIVDTYKSKLGSIDCKYFDFGNASCPFGTSCFYKHAHRDGRLEQVVLRHLAKDDGQTVIAKNLRLSDFLSSLNIR